MVCAKRIVRTVAISALLVFGWAGTVAANPDYRWQATDFKDAGRFTAILTYGVPETDDQIFQAICQTGGSPNFIPATIGYDIRKFKRGDRITLKFVATGRAGRATHTLSGKVFEPASGEGVYGVRVHAKTNDQLWDLLSRFRTLSYRSKGGAKVKLGLKGSSKAIKKFLRNCRGILSDR